MPIYITAPHHDRFMFLESPLRDMLHQHLDVGIPRELLVAAHRQTTTPQGHAVNQYIYHDYIGNLYYLLEFAPIRTRENMIIANPVRGKLILRVKLIMLGTPNPVAAVTAWMFIRHEDAPVGEKGGDVTPLQMGPTGAGPRGPRRAGGTPPGPAARAAPRRRRHCSVIFLIRMLIRIRIGIV